MKAPVVQKTTARHRPRYQLIRRVTAQRCGFAVFKQRVSGETMSGAGTIRTSKRRTVNCINLPCKARKARPVPGRNSPNLEGDPFAEGMGEVVCLSLDRSFRVWFVSGDVGRIHRVDFKPKGWFYWRFSKVHARTFHKPQLHSPILSVTEPQVETIHCKKVWLEIDSRRVLGRVVWLMRGLTQYWGETARLAA